MAEKLLKLIEAEKKAALLFDTIQEMGIVVAGKTENEVNTEIYNVALELFGITKYWHKRIVRSGKNTLLPYRENPPNHLIEKDDIIFFDFGPVFDEWEADFGRTYVLGNDARKLKLAKDIEAAWYEGKAFYHSHKEDLTSSDFYFYTKNLAEKYGWEFGNKHCGHLIGNFPHERILGDEIINYIHPNNHTKMNTKDKLGEERYWIYEIHFIDKRHEIGGFFEQLIS